MNKFTGLSFREEGTVKLLEEHLGLKSVSVLDPTKPDYDLKEKFIFVYQLDQNPLLVNTIEKASEKLNMKIYNLSLYKNDYIESFIYGIFKIQAIIIDSFHGTIFSIIFKKPFLSFSNPKRGKARFDSLKKLFSLNNRIKYSEENTNININLLLEPLNIDQTKFNKLKQFSINYLKKNLDIL